MTKTSLLDIPDRANTLFKQVHDTKCMKGKSGDAIASACLYIACRQEAVPRTFKVSDSTALSGHGSCGLLLCSFTGSVAISDAFSCCY